MRTAADLSYGETAVIKSVDTELSDDIQLIRLMEIGFTPGQEITLLAKAPFRDPIALSVRGTVFSLRVNEAECIKI